jgi:outer membrane biosynthesis protein TonB
MNAKPGKLVFIATLMLVIALGGQQARAQLNAPVEKRQVKHLVTPQFPDLPKKLNLSGTVKIEVLIGADGIVKRSRVLGGHPVLAAEAEHDADKSTFEPAPKKPPKSSNLSSNRRLG